MLFYNFNNSAMDKNNHWTSRRPAIGCFTDRWPSCSRKFLTKKRANANQHARFITRATEKKFLMRRVAAVAGRWSLAGKYQGEIEWAQESDKWESVWLHWVMHSNRAKYKRLSCQRLLPESIDAFLSTHAVMPMDFHRSHGHRVHRGPLVKHF